MRPDKRAKKALSVEATKSMFVAPEWSESESEEDEAATSAGGSAEPASGSLLDSELLAMLAEVGPDDDDEEVPTPNKKAVSGRTVAKAAVKQRSRKK